jgi:hypothetical protein
MLKTSTIVTRFQRNLPIFVALQQDEPETTLSRMPMMDTSSQACRYLVNDYRNANEGDLWVMVATIAGVDGEDLPLVAGLMSI